MSDPSVSKKYFKNHHLDMKPCQDGKPYTSHLEEFTRSRYVKRCPPIGNEVKKKSLIWFKR
jgi:hypothetical protein